MTDKVVSLKDKKKELEAEEAAKKPETATEADFAAIAAANEAKKKKLEKERLQANKSVLRSYRIKN